MNIGDLVYLKTTGEKVVVLGTTETGLSVRRPVVGTDGVRHLTETFQAAELETFDEQATREFAEMARIQEHKMALREKTGGKAGNTDVVPFSPIN